MSSNQTISLSLSVQTDKQDDAVKAAEVLSRALLGLSLEGLSASLHIMTLEDE